jgi:hypothetical protein
MEKIINQSNDIKFETLSTLTKIRINSFINTDNVIVLIPTRMSDMKRRKDSLITMLNWWEETKLTLCLVCIDDQKVLYENFLIDNKIENINIISYKCKLLNRDYNVGDARNACLLIARSLNLKQVIICDDDVILKNIDRNKINDLLVECKDTIVYSFANSWRDLDKEKKYYDIIYAEQCIIVNIEKIKQYNLWYCPLRFMEDIIFGYQCSVIEQVKQNSYIQIDHLCDLEYSMTRNVKTLDEKTYSKQELDGLEMILKYMCKLKIIEKTTKYTISWTKNCKSTTEINYEYLYDPSSIVAKMLNKIFKGDN